MEMDPSHRELAPLLATLLEVRRTDAWRMFLHYLKELKAQAQQELEDEVENWGDYRQMKGVLKALRSILEFEATLLHDVQEVRMIGEANQGEDNGRDSRRS